MPTQKLFSQLDGLLADEFDFDSSIDSYEDEAYDSCSTQDEHQFLRNNSTKSNSTLLSAVTCHSTETASTEISSSSTYRQKSTAYNHQPYQFQKQADQPKFMPYSEKTHQEAVTKSIRLHRNLHQQDANLNNILDCLHDMSIQEDARLNQMLQSVIEDIQTSVPHNTHTIENFKLQFNRVKGPSKSYSH
ncbi:uncharacterized protein CANTADRAFT_27572 [Suhomyces tanzawaensis NRRL Y-17324]|uniref:Uncharacterized protein n=1 Tax=Suhomyces tanzawaensis NRRL Y-17324 TaxID=984487 RepID=A0A1E4SB97_9ASCO|nr:uncharacterized protein CANTADRAFT_27572 [Suhomyces tanzawaensis NRRL Y-17324]ODV76800.1 hypothetical protein CANTADRAFT_27572 [Suhomyces tanzawaensis NRRL Y-17324]